MDVHLDEFAWQGMDWAVPSSGDNFQAARTSRSAEPTAGPVERLWQRFWDRIASLRPTSERRGMQLALRPLETLFWVPWAARIRFLDTTAQSHSGRVATLEHGGLQKTVVLYRLEPKERMTHKVVLHQVQSLLAMHHERVQGILGTCATPSSLSSPWELYLVTAFVNGQGVLQHLQNSPTTNRRALILDVANALAYLHENCVVHGDLHADKILVGSNGRATLCVTSCTHVAPSTDPSPPPVPVWTLAVSDAPERDPDASPECVDETNSRGGRLLRPPFEAAGDIDPATAGEARSSLRSRTLEQDVFAFGILIVELYTQVPSTSSPSAIRLVRMALKRQRPPHPGRLAELRGLDPDIWRLCHRCWSVDESEPCTAKAIADHFGQESTNSVVCPVFWPEAVVQEWASSRLPQFTHELAHIEKLDSHRGISYNYKEFTALLTHDENAIEVMLYYPQQSRRMHLNHELHFYGEAAVWLQLNHPHVLPLLGIYTAQHWPCYVVSRAAGGTCLDYLKAHPSTDILRLVLQVAEGLDYMHSRAPSIMHGDVRAHSVVVSADGNAALWNFDFRPEADPVAGFDCSAFELPNQNRWTSPERLRSGEFDTPSDVWGFGMFMWELFSGRVPFDTLGGTMIFDAIVELRLPERPDHVQLDDAAWDIITACWQRLPAARPCMSEVAKRIRSILCQRTIHV